MVTAPLTENEVRYQNAALADENKRLRDGVAAIMAATIAATIAGRVCDDVAWFDTITDSPGQCTRTEESK